MESLDINLFKFVIDNITIEDILNLTLIGPLLYDKCHRCVNFILDKFYPNIHHTMTPWKQFTALHNGVKTYLDIDFVKDPRIDYRFKQILTEKFVLLKESATRPIYNKKFTHYCPLKIDGILPQNCTYWIMNDMETGDNVIYKTREELARDQTDD